LVKNVVSERVFVSWNKSDKILEKAKEVVHVLVHKFWVVLDHNNQNLTDAHHRLELTDKLAHFKVVLGNILRCLLLIKGCRHELENFDQVIFDIVTYALLSDGAALLSIPPPDYSKFTELTSKFKGMDSKCLDGFWLLGSLCM
jgi:hypothetical protein